MGGPTPTRHTLDTLAHLPPSGKLAEDLVKVWKQLDDCRAENVSLFEKVGEHLSPSVTICHHLLPCVLLYLTGHGVPPGMCFPSHLTAIYRRPSSPLPLRPPVPVPPTGAVPRAVQPAAGGGERPLRRGQG